MASFLSVNIEYGQMIARRNYIRQLRLAAFVSGLSEERESGRDRREHAQTGEGDAPLSASAAPSAAGDRVGRPLVLRRLRASGILLEGAAGVEHVATRGCAGLHAPVAVNVLPGVRGVSPHEDCMRRRASNGACGRFYGGAPASNTASTRPRIAWLSSARLEC